MSKCYVKGCENEEEYPSLYCKDCKEIPSSLMSKEDMEKLEKEILEKAYVNAVENLRLNFYDKVEQYIYETHRNVADKVMQEALDLIIGKQRSKYRDNYDMKELRVKLYNEHKQDIDKDITEQIIEEGVLRLLGVSVFNGITYNHKCIKGNIGKWILQNTDNETLKKLVSENLIIENKNLKDTVKWQQDKIDEIKNITD